MANDKHESIGFWTNRRGIRILTACMSCKHCSIDWSDSNSIEYVCHVKHETTRRHLVCGSWEAKDIYKEIGKADGHELRVIDKEAILSKLPRKLTRPY